MKQEIPLNIILETPPTGVDFAVQKGSGSNYEAIQKQRSTGKDLHFEFTISVKFNNDGSPNFSGPISQGPPNERFIYIDIGTYAGQTNSLWGRRLKIPLKGITTAMVNKLLSGVAEKIETKAPGTGRDGGPNCGTVKPFGGWHLLQNKIVGR